MNWNEIWKEQMTAWRESSGKPCRNYWEDKKSARKYLDEGLRKSQPRIRETVDALPIKPDSRILDIGSGPGVLAVPMAEKAAHVTTVEPSPGMNEVMADYMAEKYIGNISCIEKSWEDVDIESDLVGPYDLVIASMSLGMPDIQGAIEKMEAVCSGHVVLYWHAGIPEWEKMPGALWPKIYRKEYQGGPKSDVLFMVLYQMGIFPEVEVTHHDFHETFSSMEDAVEHYATRFNITDRKFFPLLEEYIEENLIKNDGCYIHRFHHTTMKFRWETGEKH